MKNYISKSKDYIQYEQLAPKIESPKLGSMSKFIESAENLPQDSPKKVKFEESFKVDSPKKPKNAEILTKLQQKLFEANNLTLEHPIL